jgi:hypothetical protein
VQRDFSHSYAVICASDDDEHAPLGKRELEIWARARKSDCGDAHGLDHQPLNGFHDPLIDGHLSAL